MQLNHEGFGEYRRVFKPDLVTDNTVKAYKSTLSPCNRVTLEARKEP